MSSTGDITAFVLMFPPRIPEEKYIMLPFFWIPEDTIPQRVRRASVPYDVWYQQGYLMATEGNVIHYGFIEKVIEELGKTYHILEIAFDRWGAVQMTQNLEGIPAEEGGDDYYLNGGYVKLKDAGVAQQNKATAVQQNQPKQTQPDPEEEPDSENRLSESKPQKTGRRTQ